jgi:hypothetical protein
MPATGLEDSAELLSSDSTRISQVQHFILFDRKSQLHHSGEDVIMPQFYDGLRTVKMSSDPRQNLCIQCHAPDPFHQVGTGDDRTPTGVHEGFSCLACHKPHSGDTAGSCRNCHPAMSNCGLDVEKMNTTFSDPGSPNNIHFVSCMDCHPQGKARKSPAILKPDRSGT